MSQKTKVYQGNTLEDSNDLLHKVLHSHSSKTSSSTNPLSWV